MLKGNMNSEQKSYFDVCERNGWKKGGTTENCSTTMRKSKSKDFATRKNHSMNQTINEETRGEEKKCNLSIRPTLSLDECRSDQINPSRVNTLVESDESGIRVILEKCEESEEIDDLMKDIRLQDSNNESRPADDKGNDATLDATTSSQCQSSAPYPYALSTPCTANNRASPRKTFLGISHHSLRKSKSFDETESERIQRPVVNKCTDFIARNTTSTAPDNNIRSQTDSRTTSKDADKNIDSRRKRYRRQASEPKKSKIHPEKRHTHKRTTSDPISQRLKKNNNSEANQIDLSVNNSTDNNSLSIPLPRRAWASTPAKPTDESPTMLLRRKFAKSRATSMPESSRHALAFENTSFDENEGHIPVEPVVHPVVNVDEVFARCNVQDWSLEDLLIEEKKIHLRDFSWVLNDHNQVFGAEEIIHLPRKLSIVDLNTFEKVRYIRRNAIHIYDTTEFKQILKRHIIRKHAFSYEY